MNATTVSPNSSFPWIDRASGLADDSVLMKEIIRLYGRLAPENPLRKALEERLLVPGRVAKWLEGEDRSIVSSLLETLPPSRLSPHAEILEGLMKTFPEEQFNPVPALLAQIDPVRAAGIFLRGLETPPEPGSPTRSAIAGTLSTLPEETARPLFERLLATEPRSFLLARALAASAFRFRHERLAELLSFLAGEGDLGSLASAMGHDPFFDLAREARNGGVTTFQELAPFFVPETPLSEFDRIAREDRFSKAAALLAERSRQSFEAQAVFRFIGERPENSPEERWPDATALALAAVAGTYVRDRPDTEPLTLGETIRLLCLDLSWNPFAQDLAARLSSFPVEELYPAVKEALAENRESRGLPVLVGALGTLRSPVFVPDLVSLLSEEWDESVCQSASEALSAIGAASRDFLLSGWEDLDFSQRIFGASIVGQIGGPTVVDFLLGQTGTLYREDRMLWCDLALTSPDPRLLPHILAEVRREDPSVDQAGYVLLTLFDPDHPERPKLLERILRENRSAIEGTEDFPRLSLICQECGESNVYMVRKIVIGTRDEDPMVAEEFPCRSCGRLADFEIDPRERLFLLYHIFRQRKNEQNGRPGSPLEVNRVGVTTATGETLSFPEAYREYREKLRHDPDDVRTLLRMSNLLLHLDRTRAALDLTTRAQSLTPLLIEIVNNHILILKKLGRLREAFEFASRAFSDRSRWESVASNPDNEFKHYKDFEELYNGLADDLGLSSVPRIHVERKGPSPSKTGRNDPCPCGSGKKYKKCCLRG
ncbi:MAG: SEC-C metal-binding domain-containing protein [Nitrospirae bacterium]|nr:SEC-C metal-binding domain-containing protein [Nitrospirota bacterium]